jgi:RNA 2',3'-cyclic 3'-phosphodiesterase
MRAFLAVEIDDELKNVLSGLIDKLAQAGKGISWVKPDQMHLTLWFFEDLDEGVLGKVADSIEAACLGESPFELEIKKTGFFSSGPHPRVFWCGFGGNIARLNALYSKIENNLRGIGIRGDGKPFRPHLTLGRNKIASKQEHVVSLLNGLKDYSVGTFKAGEITLFRSELQRDGAVHTPVKRFILGGGI